MPSEILVKIFVCCVNGSSIQLPPISFSSMPWVLGRICSRWRKISLAEHRLWVTFYLRSHKYPVAVIRRMLVLSGPRPITLNILSAAHPHTIFPFLVENCRRFRSLTIPILSSTSDHLGHIASFDRLDSLTLHMYDIGRETPINRPGWSAPQSLRRLNLISVVDFYLKLQHTRINPTSSFWAHLTHFWTNSEVVILPSTFLKILRQCKILVAFRVVLRTFFDSDQADAGTGSIVVPTLRSIDIELDSTVMEAFFAPLTLPSLRVVEMRSRIGELWSQPLLDLENRSGCRVEVFISDNIPLELLEATMKALPDVIEFRVETREPIPDSIVER
jgi:hypothetical protein